MKKFFALAMIAVATPAVANPYVVGRIGVSDFVLNTSQYHVLHEGLPRSTIVDGKLSEVNAAYHVGLGYDFDFVRIDGEVSYGHYALAGNWSLIDSSNGIPGIKNLVQPATYSLKDSMLTFMLNAHVDVWRFGYKYNRAMYTNLCDSGEVRTYNSLFLTAGFGMSRISSTGKVVVDFNTLYEDGGFVYSTEVEDSINRFAFNLGGGMSVGLTEHMNLDLEYRYTNFGSMSADLVDRKYSAHELSAGLRYTF